MLAVVTLADDASEAQNADTITRTDRADPVPVADPTSVVRNYGSGVSPRGAILRTGQRCGTEQA
ncbi:MAG: hypothetical protein ACR2G7_06980 [Acidimicrobiales bacterium]